MVVKTRDRPPRRIWPGTILIAVGLVTTAAGFAAAVQGAQSGRYVLVAALVVGYVGWLSLPKRPDLGAEAQKGWRGEGPLGIPMREYLIQYGIETVAFLVLGFEVGWYWAAMICLAAGIAWTVLRTRGPR